MGIEQFDYADRILRLFWEHKQSDRVVYKESQIIQLTGLTEQEFIIGLKIILPDGYLKSPYKADGDGDIPYKITNHGLAFFNRTSYVKDYKRLNQTTFSQQVNVNTAGGDAIGIGNIGNPNIEFQRKEDKEPWYEGIVIKTIMTIVATVIAAFLVYYFGWNNQ